MVLFIMLPIVALILGLKIGEGKLNDYSVYLKATSKPAPATNTPMTSPPPIDKNINVGFGCLPANLKPSFFVYVEPGNGNRTTIDKKLKSLGASCNSSKLMTSSGREIYFFNEDPKFCQGTPVEDYEIRKQNQVNEIAKLTKTYEVIEVTCNPDGKRSA